MKLGSAFSDSVTKHKSNTKESFDDPRGQSWQEGLVSLIANKHVLTSRVYVSTWRHLIFYIITLLVFFALFVRLFQLQVIEGSTNRVLSDGNRIQIRILHAPRGVVYDRNGEVLTRNVPGFRLRKEDGTYKVISRDEALQYLSSHESSQNLEVDTTRQYLYPELFAHVLGFTSEISKEELQSPLFIEKRYRMGDRIGRAGIEETYEGYLRGQDGRDLVEVDAKGEVVRELGKEEPLVGQNVYLYHDLGLQQVAAKALGSYIGAVVVQDPRNGAILALYSNPSFNSNLFTYGILEEEYLKLLNDPQKPLFNRATSGLYPPGSTFKIVTATAALEENIVTPKTIVEDKGSISIGSYVYRGWKPEGLGNVSLREAIAKSSDIYFYTIGGGYGGINGVGVKKLHDWAVRYGFGQGTKIDLPTESQGLVPDEEWKIVTKGEKWFLGNTYQMAIGQGDVLTTPLQINMMTTVVANNGILYAPQNVWKVHSPEGIESVFAPRELTRNVASEETLRVIQEGMRMAAQPGGTAFPFFTFPIEVAGKTGTAEFGDPKDRTHAWFTAYAPYKNPEITVTVLVEGQYGGGEGASVAAPIAKEIMQYYFLDRKEPGR